ncbi:hypothetical protein CNY89_15995 [Amaricoccus sp. HAR-UPW-R2A-40]|nr:hypothetical protein CNY89_15995 [Amaricoccus sp. HAR-UPW-R2A-40]
MRVARRRQFRAQQSRLRTGEGRYNLFGRPKRNALALRTLTVVRPAGEPSIMLRAVFCLLLALGAPPAQAAAWRLDPETQVVVDVPWRGSDVAVRFPDLRGEVTFDEKAPETARARIEASAAGAETGVGVVNALIRSPGYLDAEAFPVIAFQLDRLRRLSKSTRGSRGG